MKGSSIYYKFFQIVSISLILTFQFSCQRNIKDKQGRGVKGNRKETNFTNEDSLKIKILNGDTLAYLQLRDKFVGNDRAPEFLIWALIMSNKFNYAIANYDIYFCFQQIEAYYNSGQPTNSMDILDSTSRMLAIQYLMKASRDDPQAKKILSEYYFRGKYLQKNISLAEKLQREAKE